jgi:hypothetical protein
MDDHLPPDAAPATDVPADAAQAAERAAIREAIIALWVEILVAEYRRDHPE